MHQMDLPILSRRIPVSIPSPDIGTLSSSVYPESQSSAPILPSTSPPQEPNISPPRSLLILQLRQDEDISLSNNSLRGTIGSIPPYWPSSSMFPLRRASQISSPRIDGRQADSKEHHQPSSKQPS
ncbi:hypothetical protein BDV59DRAFT_143091 [Aspergillus ambiguus]|uniref:uncharacterized protein n=1 Tax=Aspergillus ambiguus TaxID=176160 RepID=UPI003CCC96E2